MVCKKCGKKMSDGARFCISCGAEHDAKGQLISNNAKIDLNKTVMINNNSSNNNSRIDYNKTVMANDKPLNNKVDYNKTMMASDIPQNHNIDYNKTMMANDISHDGNKKISNNQPPKTNKKKLPLIIIICVTVIFIAFLSLIIAKKKKPDMSVNETVQSEIAIETTQSGNIVSDFNSSSGYWSKDAEFFYRDGTIQKNQWIGDFYVGEDGRKVKNQLIDDTYYVDASGKKVKNDWYKFNKNVGGTNVTVWYYLGEDGAKLKDMLTPDGYYVDKDGIYIPGQYDSPDSQKYIPKDK